MKRNRKIKYFLKQTKYFIVKYHSTVCVARDIKTDHLVTF